ncbi:MAG: phosphoribosylaminoimidazolesuccinocarboxamide synthase [Candidatus Methanofastidiosia archaeon]
MQKIYEGKSKILYSHREDVVIEFTDRMTAFDGKKVYEFKNKGFYCREISEKFFRLLEDDGIKTHFIESIDRNKILARKLDILPLEVVCRNTAAGSLLKRIPLKRGERITPPILEFYYKNDEMKDPMINEFHALHLGINKKTLEEVSKKTKKINSTLLEFLKKKKVELVDFKLEFGFLNGELLLGDEITPDSCRFWINYKSCDKDVFRFDLGNVENAYKRIYEVIVNEV